MENKQLIQHLFTNHQARQALVKEDFSWFFAFYFARYITYPSADFHRKMYLAAMEDSKETVVITAFRGSGKTTIMSQAYPIWAISGKQQKKHVLILGKTQQQAKQNLKNIKDELESNEFLKADLGPFVEGEDEWNSGSIILTKYDARITAASCEQSIRGIKHGPYRPDLIICDDIEDQDAVRTRESRDKIYNWLTGEVIPAGDNNTRIIIVGNMLHEDSMIARVKEQILKDNIKAHYLEIPLLDTEGKCTWPGKYPTKAHIDAERKRTGNEQAWMREYLLRIISGAERVIHPEWIKYYKELPPIDDKNGMKFAASGVDLAIAQNNCADFTAMVSAYAYGDGENFKVYILPNPINSRLTHLETIDVVKTKAKSLNAYDTRIYVEDVGYQGALIEHLQGDGDYYVEGVKPHGADKRTRLALVSHLVQNGNVLFPEKGAEKLITQLVNFGSERHDDLADAFSIMMTKVAQEKGYEGECANGGVIRFR